MCETDVRGAEFVQARFLSEARGDGRQAIVFVCLDDDSLSLSTALAIARVRDCAESTIIVRMAQDAGLARMPSASFTLNLCPLPFGYADNSIRYRGLLQWMRDNVG